MKLRKPPVMQSVRSPRSYEKIGDCEQSINNRSPSNGASISINFVSQPWVPSRFITRTPCFPRKVSYFRESLMSPWKKWSWMKSDSEARPSTVFLFYYTSIFTILQPAGIWVSWNKAPFDGLLSIIIARIDGDNTNYCNNNQKSMVRKLL